MDNLEIMSMMSNPVSYAVAKKLYNSGVVTIKSAKERLKTVKMSDDKKKDIIQHYKDYQDGIIDFSR